MGRVPHIGAEGPWELVHPLAVPNGSGLHMSQLVLTCIMPVNYTAARSDTDKVQNQALLISPLTEQRYVWAWVQTHHTPVNLQEVTTREHARLISKMK